MSDDLDLFSSAYQGSAPSVVSATSESAASKVTDPMRAKSYRKIFEALAARSPMTREQIMAATGIKESSACARIWELRPTWIVAHSGGGRSSAGLTVDTYELTDAGIQKWRDAAAVTQ